MYETPSILHRSCMALGLAMALAACQQSEPNPASPTATARTGSAPAVDAAPGPERAQPAPALATAGEPRSTEPEPEPVTEPVTEPAIEVRQPLNLDVPTDILHETADTNFAPSERVLLPGLFDKKKKAGRTVSPELLFKEGEDVSMDTVSGAKVTVKIPVN